MATFYLADLPAVAALARVHPDQTRFWTWVASEAGDGYVTTVATEFLDALDGGTNTKEVESLQRIGDAIQELQAIEQVVTLSEVESDGAGRTTERILTIDTSVV